MLTLDSPAPTTLAMDDPYATQDGTMTVLDYLDPMERQTLDSLAHGVGNGPRSVRMAVLAITGGTHGGFNRAIQRLKGLGVIGVDEAGMIWRR